MFEKKEKENNFSLKIKNKYLNFFAINYKIHIFLHKFIKNKKKK
jgi:hypothetical protein